MPLARPGSCCLAIALAPAFALVPSNAWTAEPESRAYDGPASVAATRDASPRPPPVAARPMGTLGPADDAPPPAVDRSTPGVPRSQVGAEPRDEVRIRLGLDLAITLGVAAPTAGLGLWVEPSLPDRVPMPGTEPDVGKFDRLALGRFERGPKLASDILLATSIGAPLVYHAVQAGVQRRGWSRVRGRGFLARYGTDVLIISQAIAINALLTQILKSAVRRPRPYAFLDPSQVPERDRQELIDSQNSTQVDWSFPSGHASTAFTATTAGATLLTLELLGRAPWAIACAWVGGMGVAATTGILRVMAGRHFPSDVATSALIGIGVGVAVPLAHWRPTPRGDHVQRRPIRNLAIAPVTSSNAFGLSVTGVLR